MGPLKKRLCEDEAARVDPNSVQMILLGAKEIPGMPVQRIKATPSYSQKVPSCKPREIPQEKTKPANTLLLHLYPPELYKHEVLLLKPQACDILLWLPWQSNNLWVPEKLKDGSETQTT